MQWKVNTVVRDLREMIYAPNDVMNSVHIYVILSKIISKYICCNATAIV